MGKIGKLRKKFTAFVDQLSPDQVREQLILAYLQMEQCQRVLRGEDVDPVEMIDNGESSDLELFYQCKKASDELAHLNSIASKPDGIQFKIGVDMSESIDAMKKLRSELEKIHKAANVNFERSMNLNNVVFNQKYDWSKIFVALHKQYLSDLEDIDNRPKNPEKKNPVYFMYKGRIHKSANVNYFGIGLDGKIYVAINGYKCLFIEEQLSSDPEKLAYNVCSKFSTHKSLSTDHISAFFIDETNRVFMAAAWYLEDQKIEHFPSLDDLRSFLISNVIDDTKK